MKGKTESRNVEIMHIRKYEVGSTELFVGVKYRSYLLKTVCVKALQLKVVNVSQ